MNISFWHIMFLIPLSMLVMIIYSYRRRFSPVRINMGGCGYSIGKLGCLAIVMFILLGVGSCFFTCGNGVLRLHKQYMDEMAAQQKERRERYPSAGMGKATMVAPIKCYLDPKRSHTRPSGPVKYVFAADPKIYYIDKANSKVNNMSIWWKMPAGNYLIYPLKEEAVEVSWW